MNWSYDQFAFHWLTIMPLRPAGDTIPVGSMAIGRVYHSDHINRWVSQVYVSEPFPNSDLAMKTVLVMRRTSATLDEAQEIVKKYVDENFPK